MAALLGSLTYAIIETDPLFAGIAAGALVGLLVYEPRRREPLIDLRFFRSAPFSGATVVAICAFAGFGGFLFLNTLYLQEVRGLSPMDAGLYMLPMAGMTFVFAPLSGRLTGARGPRLPLLLAGTAMAAGALLFAAFGAETRDPLLFTGYVAFGIGFGLVNAPITNTAVSGMPRAQAGVAAAVASTSRQVGQTLGVAVVGAVLAAGVGAGMSPDDYVAAARPAYWVVTACGLAVLAVGALTSGKWARRTAQRTARCLETEDGPQVGAGAGTGLRRR